MTAYFYAEKSKYLHKKDAGISDENRVNGKMSVLSEIHEF